MTNAETEFAFNIISKFHEKLNTKTFINWGKSMEGKSQKRLIQYSQYLNIAKMQMEDRPGSKAYEEQQKS